MNDRVSELEENDIQNNNALFIEVDKSDNKTVDYYYGFVSKNYYYIRYKYGYGNEQTNNEDVIDEE